MVAERLHERNVKDAIKIEFYEIVMKRKLLPSLLLFVYFFSPTQLSAGNATELEVFVSIPPQKWLCEQLGADFLQVGILVGKGQEPHGFETTPRQIQSLAGSTLFFTVGMEFEREIVRRLQTGSPNLRIVDSSKTIQKISMAGAGHGHKTELDPHVWLSPINLKSMAAVMVSALVEEDPEHAKVYEKNLHNLNNQLDKLDHSITAKLAPFSGASFFVFHPAFGYFAHDYQMHQIAVETGGKSPTPRQLFGLIKQAKNENVQVIFVQPQFDPRSAESVAEAIGGRVVPLDSLAEDVFANLAMMATKIEQALMAQENR